MGAWKQIAALPNRRIDAAACFHDGKVYVFGGRFFDSGFGAVYETTLYIYDPAGNTWSTGAALPTAGLCYAFSTAADGIHVIYPATGAHYAYDPVDNTWATRTAVPAVDRRDAHHFADAAGLIYLAGGAKGSGSGTAVKVHRYDPDTDTWATRADMPTAIAARAATMSPGVLGSDNKVYLGYGGPTTGLTVYDPGTDTWATTAANLPDAPATMSFNVSRTPAGVVLVLPRKISAAVMRRVDGYDPATGTWTMGALPDSPGSAFRAAVATEPGGLIYLIGGLVFDSSGIETPTPEAWSYKQNEPPTAPTPRTMTGGVTVSTAVKNRASWTFNDPNVGDSQSGYDFFYRPTGTTVWTEVNSDSPNPWYEYPAGSLTPVEYEWQLVTYDAAGEPSPRMTSAVFTALDPPAGPTITDPINGQTVEQTHTVVFSAAALDAYELRRVADIAGVADTGTVYFDTGEVAEPLTRSLAVAFPVNDRFEHVQVRVKKDGLWSGWDDVLVDVSYTPPPAPTFTVYPDESTGSLLVMIANPDPGVGIPAAAYNDVYVDDGNGLERKATELATTTPWRYWTPISGRDYEGRIRVVAVAANGTTASSEETP